MICIYQAVWVKWEAKMKGKEPYCLFPVHNQESDELIGFFFAKGKEEEKKNKTNRPQHQEGYGFGFKPFI